MVDSEAAGNLPEEIITEILVRLPVRSIGRSRCVSKPWRSLLTSNDFIKTHLARQVQEEKLLLLSTCHSLFTLTLHPDSYLLAKLELESFDKKLISLVGSCNGLVLGVTKGNGMCLINCLTREYANLSNPPFWPPGMYGYDQFTSHGFGYDSLSDDYKIVSVYYNDKYKYDGALRKKKKKKYDGGDVFSVVDVYSVKERSWRRLGNFLGVDLLPDTPSAGVFFNGVLHWMGRKMSSDMCVIVAFDLSCEEFQEISSPLSLDRAEYNKNVLVVIEGCLGIVSQPTRDWDELVEIWVMNTYSLAESWTKKISIKRWFAEVWKPVYLHKDKLLFLGYDGKFIWYYPDDKRWESYEWILNDNPEFMSRETYSETLLHFNTHL